MYTYLMLTMRTEKFNQEHVAGHYEFLDRLQAEKRFKNVWAIQRRHRRSVCHRSRFAGRGSGNRACGSAGGKRIF